MKNIVDEQKVNYYIKYKYKVKITMHVYNDYMGSLFVLLSSLENYSSCERHYNQIV